MPPPPPARGEAAPLPPGLPAQLVTHLSSLLGWALFLAFLFVPWVHLLALLPSVAPDARGVPRPLCFGLATHNMFLSQLAPPRLPHE